MAHILVVEDDADLRGLLQSVLRDTGHEAICANTFAEAHAVVHSARKLDLVFTDIELGSEAEGGLRIGRIVAQRRPDTPILYTTGRPLSDVMREQFIPASAFIPKPYTADAVLDQVALLLCRDPFTWRRGWDSNPR
jgi:DNA-binding NtrC family response regulator